MGTVLYVCQWDADAKDGSFGDMTLPQPEVTGAETYIKREMNAAVRGLSSQ